MHTAVEHSLRMESQMGEENHKKLVRRTKLLQLRWGGSIFGGYRPPLLVGLAIGRRSWAMQVVPISAPRFADRKRVFPASLEEKVDDNSRGGDWDREAGDRIA
jgi:hypothetical protein